MPLQTTSKDPGCMERLSVGGHRVCDGVVAGMPARIIWEHDPQLSCGHETQRWVKAWQN